MLGSCNFILDNDQRCKSTYNIHGIIFLNPETPGTLERIDLCKLHHDHLTEEHTQRVREYQMKINNLIVENIKRKKIARANDTYYDESIIKRQIDDTRIILKQITILECKNYFCNADLSKIDKYKKVYTAITLKSSNKKCFVFYFCSNKCFNSFKARCGLVIPIKLGQLQL